MLEIISPHIDDAPFSLASLILQLNADHTTFEITSCFSISDYHTGTEFRSQEDVSLLRKQEDEAFESVLSKNVKFNYLNLLDAPLRGYKKCTFSGTLTEMDALQVDKMHQYLLSRTSQQYIVPLSLGDHIDHVITQEATLKLPSGSIAAFFEDLPYAGRSSTADIIDRVKHLEDRIGLSIFPVITGQQFSHDKLNICSLYGSQLKDWYLENIARQLSRHKGGECLWVVDFPDNELLGYLSIHS